MISRYFTGFKFRKPQALKRQSVTRRFLRETDGNIIILFVFMSTVLFFFVGGAIDYSRWNAIRADMIESMDAASLALARVAQNKPGMSDADLKKFGTKFFYENFNYEDLIYKPGGVEGDEPVDIIDFKLDDDAVVEACVSGRLDTYLLRVVGQSYFDINKCVEITKKGSGRVELALVLDVTGSMNNSIGTKKKIESLKDAVTTMLDVMYKGDPTSENLRIGVVPFNAYVNPGGASSWSNNWNDADAEAVYHGARFFHVTESGDIDMNVKVNHFDLYESTPGVEWAGCVEARPYPLDELDVPTNGSITSTEIDAALQIPTDLLGATSSEGERTYDAFDRAPSLALSKSILTDTENLRWVPLFHPDEPDCDDRQDCEASDYNDSDTGTTTHGTPWAGDHFNDPDRDNDHPSGNVNESSYGNRFFISDHWYTNHKQSPAFDNYAKQVHYYRQVLDGAVTDNNFRNFLGTIGVDLSDPDHALDKQEYIFRTAYVGWWDPATETYDYKYDLSPSITSSRGPNRNCASPILPLTNVRDTVETHVKGLKPSGYTNSANGAAWGWRVLSSEPPFTEGIGPIDEDYDEWQKAVVIMTDGENTIENRSVHWNSGLGANGHAIESRMGANMTRRNRMRNEIDNKLLRICYRMKSEGYIVYTIMFGLDSSRAEKVFKACATEPNEPYFYDAVDGDDLIDAFGDIAADLVDLHVSK